jgi:hypothetical protein
MLTIVQSIMKKNTTLALAKASPKSAQRMEIFQILFLGEAADSASSISDCFPRNMVVLLESPVTSSTNLAR